MSHDLTDAEFAELDELLAQTPEPFEPLDAVMLDGYLCGVIVQPVLLEAEAWLPHVFDFEGQPLPDDADPAWRARTEALILRRHAALTRAIAEDGWFDPLILELDDFEPPRTDDPAASLKPVSQALFPWVAGFQHAMESFPDLLELPDPAIDVALARLYRHLPAQTDEEREVVATLDAEHPLATLDEAIEDLIVIIADLEDLTRDRRYKVETIKRETPKVGRNDPCPCGSGKKYKNCHGQG
ncbi:MAG: UPF0149 family protein [Piscinibacter sp.]|uniref:UPF0149 family protein n=1 Tax=Piscinibacter sp. TaxID=1903157 RepID=UPI001B51B570|nr:UPF0149 family protein [Piscinibacter sp.]MBP5990029.1 UPF0149 family protein [Piscinibacter sp.]MBP6026586.1 UPF0149 family protein [Piscinibacter sp.]